MNRWNIPRALEAEVEARDRACIYCGRDFALASKRGERKSWEHIINDANKVSRENIAFCCISCNASKGNKELTAWLKTAYCRKRGIHAGSIARVAQDVLRVTMGEKNDVTSPGACDNEHRPAQMQ